MRTYELNEHQKWILKEVSKLPTTELYYITVQQHIQHTNLTLNELKKYLIRSVREYVRRKYRNDYYPDMENQYIKYIAFFENTKDFFMSQHTDNIVASEFYSGFHFHVFISNIDEGFVKELTYQLNSQKNKKGCISKIDRFKLGRLDEDFILYHTKQMMYRYSPQLILKNY